ncbi:tryptophan 7-halogenase [Streptomyces sp. LX-29]|uniref:NAD(P)/FAD-dependent oxidoreductase n=1 Tax=Streptomyces sp. LX-29 TaxID=2900152 RepID=UPI00240E066F|nr:tryptophan 7-halogenase [Streptomyces sp. LX-29]WFB10737.1 tryptophan 7-halogenase [Streptomyces sp. LX-29]
MTDADGRGPEPVAERDDAVDTVDVVVAGAGPAGAATALALARAGAAVLLVDPGPQDDVPVGDTLLDATLPLGDSFPGDPLPGAPFPGDPLLGVSLVGGRRPPRSARPASPRIGESLPPAARVPLARLGVLETVLRDGHAPCHGHRSAWGHSDLADSAFLQGPYGPGWHLDRDRFDASLRRAARSAGARLRRGGVSGLARVGDRWRVTVSTGTGTGTGGAAAYPGRGPGRAGRPRPGAETCVLHASYVVDATGARARVARRLGARLLATDHLVAVGALLPAADGADGGAGGGGSHGDGGGGTTGRCGEERTSLVESVPYGWWYTAPLPHGRRVVMAVTDADLARPAGLRTAPGWWGALRATRHVAELLVGHGGRVERTVLSAGTSRTVPAAGPGWVAVGDAASATDPLAVRGITAALATGLAAAAAIAADAAGDRAALPRYARVVDAVHTEFLHARAAYYQAERRWDGPFWQRRSGPPPPLLDTAGHRA